jgi:hypothetical protein
MMTLSERSIMANEKFSVVGKNIAEKAIMIWTNLVTNLRRMSNLFWGENTNTNLGKIIWNHDSQMSVDYFVRKR